MHANVLSAFVLLAGAPVLAQDSTISSAAYSGVATSSTSSSSMTPAGAAPSVTSQTPTTTSNATSFTTSLEFSVEGRRISAWEALLTQLRLVEHLCRTGGSLFGKLYSIPNSDSNK